MLGTVFIFLGDETESAGEGELQGDSSECEDSASDDIAIDKNILY